VKAALAGHICRCSAYPNIIRTVMDSAPSCRKQDAHRGRTGIRRSYQNAMVAGLFDEWGTWPALKSSKARTRPSRKVAGVSTGKSQRISKARLRCPNFHSEVHRQGAIRQPRLVPRSALHEFLTCPHPHALIKDIERRTRRKCGVNTFLHTRMRRSCNPQRCQGQDISRPLPRELNFRVRLRPSWWRRPRTRAGCRRRDQGNVRSAAIRITAEGQHGC